MIGLDCQLLYMIFFQGDINYQMRERLPLIPDDRK